MSLPKGNVNKVFVVIVAIVATVRYWLYGIGKKLLPLTSRPSVKRFQDKPNCRLT